MFFLGIVDQHGANDLGEVRRGVAGHCGPERTDFQGVEFASSITDNCSLAPVTAGFHCSR